MRPVPPERAPPADQGARNRSRALQRGHFAAAVGLALIYAVCYSAIKAGLPYAPPLRFGALRAVIAGALLLGLLAILRRSILPPRHLWPGIVLIAATGTFVAYAAMFSAPGRTGAGIASVLGNTTPLVTFALAAPLLGEPLTRPRVLAMALGFAGAALTVARFPSAPVGAASWGGLLPLAAASGFAVSSVTVKRLDTRGAVLQVAAWQLIVGGIPLLGLSAATERAAVIWVPTFLTLLLLLAIVGTALTTAAWYWLLERDDVGRLSLALFAVPAAGLAIAMAAFGERVSGTAVAGVALILAALVVAALERGPRPGAIRGPAPPAGGRPEP